MLLTYLHYRIGFIEIITFCLLLIFLLFAIVGWKYPDGYYNPNTGAAIKGNKTVSTVLSVILLIVVVALNYNTVVDGINIYKGNVAVIEGTAEMKEDILYVQTKGYNNKTIKKNVYISDTLVGIYDSNHEHNTGQDYLAEFLHNDFDKEAYYRVTFLPKTHYIINIEKLN